MRPNGHKLLPKSDYLVAQILNSTHTHRTRSFWYKVAASELTNYASFGSWEMSNLFYKREIQIMKKFVKCRPVD
jgi:hypothetical protein